MSVKTVWRATTPEQNKQDRESEVKVRVVDREPDDGGPVVFEIHVPETDLDPTDVDGEYEFVWADLDRYPHQVRYR